MNAKPAPPLEVEVAFSIDRYGDEMIEIRQDDQVMYLSVKAALDDLPLQLTAFSKRLVRRADVVDSTT